MRASGSVNGSLKITKRRPVFKNSVSGVCDRDATVPGDAGRIYGSKFRVHLPSHMDVKNENLLENDPMCGAAIKVLISALYGHHGTSIATVHTCDASGTNRCVLYMVLTLIPRRGF